MTRMHMRQWLTIPHITSALNAGKWVTFASMAASLAQKECLVTTEEEAVGPHGRFESGGSRNICLFWESNPKYQVVYIQPSHYNDSAISAPQQVTLRKLFRLCTIPK